MTFRYRATMVRQPAALQLRASMPEGGSAHDGHGDSGDEHDSHSHSLALDPRGGEHEGGGHAGHSHGVAAGADERYLAVALGLIVGFMVVEVIVAFASGSLALLADAGHMLTDAGALAGSIWAARLATRPARGAMTFGLKRAEILSASINGITLVAVAVLVAFEAIRRLVHPGNVGGTALLVVAGIGVIVNVVASWVLAKANRSSLNVEGAYQHILTDAYAFIATFIAGIIILTTGFARADAIASLVVVALMARAAYGLLTDSGRILLEAAPEGVDLVDLRKHFLDGTHVIGVHDLHVWTVTSDLPAVSAHVVVEDSCFRDGHAPQILDRLQACLVGHFDVEHSTFQLEPASHAGHEDSAHE
jgi:cobalt-zinc-cadmium efflux system protein